MEFKTDFIWHDRNIHLTYSPEYFEGVAHLEVRSADGEPLPITETGYRSHFFMTDNPPSLEEAISFVMDWLVEEAKSKKWQDYSECAKQMNLF